MSDLIICTSPTPHALLLSTLLSVIRGYRSCPRFDVYILSLKPLKNIHNKWILIHLPYFINKIDHYTNIWTHLPLKSGGAYVGSHFLRGTCFSILSSHMTFEEYWKEKAEKYCLLRIWIFFFWYSVSNYCHVNWIIYSYSLFIPLLCSTIKRILKLFMFVRCIGLNINK